MPLRDSQLKKLDAATLESVNVFELELQDFILGSQGGVGTLSMRLGYPSPESLSNEVCPTNRQAKFGALDFFLALLKTRNYRILDVMDSMLGRGDSCRSGKYENLFNAVGCMSGEHADVVQAVLDALADGNVSPRENLRINREIDELKTALDELSAMVNQHGGA